MRWRNDEQSYGLTAILLHWLTAAAILGLFGLGLWMTDLTYYDTWYHRAPEIHKGVGVLLFLVLTVRLGWRQVPPRPLPEPSLSPVERRVSTLVHVLLYLLPFAIMLSGYLISTADGRAVDVFGLFQVPALLSRLPNQADLAGEAHALLAWVLVGLAALHALAALKHHFVDRDRTLVRMLRPRRP